MVVGWLVVMVSTTGYNRLMEYIYGLLDPANASFHVQRSMEAVINGGLFGMGIGQGITKWTGLPLASTDSIFAVIAEETGLVGSIAVVLLFIIFLWRGLHIAQAAPDLQGKLLASGLTIWITMEAIINMGVMVNLFPFAGNTLPFISYSGSSITMVFASIGIMLNIVRCSNRQRESSKGRSSRAVVDLRGRNSGRGVSRAVRSTGTRR
jgi:cell division protein FtsW